MQQVMVNDKSCDPLLVVVCSCKFGLNIINFAIHWPRRLISSSLSVKCIYHFHYEQSCIIVCHPCLVLYVVDESDMMLGISFMFYVAVK